MRSSIKLITFLLAFYTVLSAGSINEELFNKAEKYYKQKRYRFLRVYCPNVKYNQIGVVRFIEPVNKIII